MKLTVKCSEPQRRFERLEVFYSTLRTYARSPGMAMVDATALLKLAQVFEVTIEELIEVIEE